MQIWASDLKSTLFYVDSCGYLAPSKTLDRPTLHPRFSQLAQTGFNWRDPLKKISKALLLATQKCFLGRQSILVYCSLIQVFMKHERKNYDPHASRHDSFIFHTCENVDIDTIRVERSRNMQAQASMQKGELLYELHFMTQSPKLSWLNNSTGWAEGQGNMATGESHGKIYAKK